VGGSAADEALGGPTGGQGGVGGGGGGGGQVRWWGWGSGQDVVFEELPSDIGCCHRTWYGDGVT
jgi:hypothetical protein